nr:MAG TPA: hypothetical protein [Caudoviricetes sp.]
MSDIYHITSLPKQAKPSLVRCRDVSLSWLTVLCRWRRKRASGCILLRPM